MTDTDGDYTSRAGVSGLSSSQQRTLWWVLAVVFGLPILGLVVLAWLEGKTLADKTPGNHITATMRAAFKAAPGAVFLGTVVWLGFLIAVAAGIAGHIFWGG